MKLSKKFRIGIWGQFGDGKTAADGQSLRTITIYNILEEKFGSSNILKLNSWNWKKRPISLFIKTIALVRKSKNILMLPANNGFKVIVPIVNFLNLFYKRNIIYIIIGGFLPELLKSRPKYISYLNKFSVLFSQTEGQIIELKELGIKNLQILPNIRAFNRVSSVYVVKNNEQSIKLVSFSRIMEEKGVEEAIDGVRLANKILGTCSVFLDFYGIISEKYETRFYRLLKENENFISYKGVAKFDESINILKNYFVLLFPTYYYGEGQPGVFLDSYFSALPIIATDWKYNKEFVKNDFNGILIPIKDPKSVCDAIIKLYKNRELHYKMKQNSLSISHDYDPNKLIQPLLNMIK